MPRVIFLCPYLKGNSRTAAKRRNYVKYIATREGVEKIDDTQKLLPSTWRQKNLIGDILNDFPETAERFEYEDYVGSPTRENASAFIAAALEQNLALVGKRENYVDYISHRPRVQRMGTHGLFGGKGEPVVLDQIAREAAGHPGNLWMPILSLRQEDAARLGYDNAANWRSLLSSYANDMARGLKIAPERFRWYAAYHDEGHHPHVHMICWSDDPREGFLTKAGIHEIKAGIASRIFRQELLHVYEQQTVYRNLLNEETKQEMETLIACMENGMLRSEPIESLMMRLADKLRSHKGKKQYGYLPAAAKDIVDRIVDELAKDGRVADAYGKWCEMRLEILRTYQKEPVHPGPLSQQKELKRIRNIVVEEAAKLSAGDFIFEPAPDDGDGFPAAREPDTDAGDVSSLFRLGRLNLAGEAVPKDTDRAILYLTGAADRGNQYAQYTLGKLYLTDADIPRDREKAWYWLVQSASQGNEYARFLLEHFHDFHDPSLFLAATRLMHHMGRVFRDNPPAHGRSYSADSKTRRREREKKIAQGHAQDEHEQAQHMN